MEGSSSPRRRTGGRSARVTQAVHRATLAALADKGLAGLSIEDIAARAGVNKTTIYRRWGTREALMADALGVGTTRQIAIPDTGSVRSDLAALARQVRDTILAPTNRNLMVALATSAGHETLAGLGPRYWAGRFAASRPIVERAIARGELPPGTDPDTLIIQVVGPLWFSVFGPGRAPDDAFVDRCVDIVLIGISHHA
ncbi:TetR/AcrR family transcriptional regulator [Nonomuraea diastatica]|uniref:TetR/AcrR family transcriptional regulator n=1 Tax=Nonomuraea diastatica TaxID=1848329 RepID=A0A4R4WHA3_9ACTN|nr:TetR/AcrR family transcriptional regulator [Nonomuraea diastatica]TDD12950.1 TetR/AcrR family transcriptional regulator [Nonomuraea diastatica]